MNKINTLSFAIGITTVATAIADQHQFRQEDSHLHGAATLNVVLEQQQLLIELESPAANIIGFEHKPANAEQEEAVHEAEEALQDGAKLFALPGAAACQLTASEVKWTLEEEHDDHDHEKEEHAEHDDHDKEEHAKHDDHDDHDKEEHAEHEHEEEGEIHSEFHVEYAFQCSSPDKLDTIDVLLFQAFSGMEEIDAQDYWAERTDCS